MEGEQDRAPQGASASPLLANIYLHYVLDRWVRQWRRRHAHGDVIITRFADDFVAGFEHQADAQRFLADLRERFAKFGLELHPDKTRLIEFGRYAGRNRQKRGEGKPETFDFLGFTHICGKTKNGSGSGASPSRSGCGRSYERSRTSSSSVGTSPYPNRADGWQAWCEAPRLLRRARQHRCGGGLSRPSDRHWFKALRRRSQKTSLTWARMDRLANRWLPPARVLHPYPEQRFDVRTLGRSPVR